MNRLKVTIRHTFEHHCNLGCILDLRLDKGTAHFSFISKFSSS